MPDVKHSLCQLSPGPQGRPHGHSSFSRPINRIGLIASIHYFTKSSRSWKEHGTADCQMMHGSLLECGADGKAMNMFQVLQKLEQAEIHTGSPWTLGSGVSVLRNTDGVTIHLIALTLTIWTLKRPLAWIP